MGSEPFKIPTRRAITHYPLLCSTRPHCYIHTQTHKLWDRFASMRDGTQQYRTRQRVCVVSKRQSSVQRACHVTSLRQSGCFRGEFQFRSRRRAPTSLRMLQPTYIEKVTLPITSELPFSADALCLWCVQNPHTVVSTGRRPTSHTVSLI